MKISELIEVLQKIDQDMYVEVDTPVNQTYHIPYSSSNEIFKVEGLVKKSMDRFVISIRFPENVQELNAQVNLSKK